MIYKMSLKQFREIMEASKPVPYLVIGGIGTPSMQENANYAWKKLADEMGFIWYTAKLASGIASNYFIAEPKTKVLNK